MSVTTTSLLAPAAEQASSAAYAVKHLLYGVSNVTGSLHSSRLEPHESYTRVACSRQLWVDDDLVPPTLLGDMPGTSLILDNAVLTANTVGSGTFYDAAGSRVVAAESAVSVGAFLRRPRSGVCKKVRASLVRGRFGEYVGASDQIDLRLVILATPTEPGYHPVLERVDAAGGYVAVLPHRWSLDVHAGVITLSSAERETATTTGTTDYVITAYIYAGRRGVRSLVPTCTDDIEEGAINRYLTRERFEMHHRDALAACTTDDIAEGSRHRYYSTDLFLRDVSERVSTDTIREGVAHKFFTSDAFDRELATKTLEDIAETPEARHLTSKNLANLDAVVGGVHALELTALVEPPSQQANRLYVANNELYFGSSPVGAPTNASSTLTSAGANAWGGADGAIGEFAGHFAGSTTGTHVGNVTGFLSGMVSSLANHPIIDADIIGTGQGQWVGTMAGDVVGRFEGAAHITDGYARNLQHVGIGTHDAEEALLHISGGAEMDGSAAHVRLTHSTSGSSVPMSCDASGALSVGGDIVCTAVRCATRLQCDGDAVVHGDLIGQHVHSVGITNAFAGIYEIGVMDGVTTLVVDDLSVSGLVSVSAMHVESTLHVRADLHVEKRLSVGSRVSVDGDMSVGGRVDIAGPVTAAGISVGTARISEGLIIEGSLSAGGIIAVPMLSVAGDISVAGKIYASGLEVPGFQPGGGGGTLTFLSVGELYVDGNATVRGDLSIGGTIYAESLSTNVVVGTIVHGTLNIGDFDAHLTAYGNEAILGDLLVTGTLHVGSIEFETLSLNDFWCGAIHASKLDVGTASASELSVGSLTVGIVQGLGALDSFPISNDAQVYGDMHVLGNVMISGLLITGAHNYMVNDMNRYIFDGHLSVQTLSIAEECDVLRELQQLRDDIGHLRACMMLHGIAV